MMVSFMLYLWLNSAFQDDNKLIAYSCNFRMKSISCKHNYCYIILPPVYDSRELN